MDEKVEGVRCQERSDHFFFFFFVALKEDAPENGLQNGITF